MNLTKLFLEYKELLTANRNLELIEKFYADDIIQYENEDRVEGHKKELIELGKKNLASVTELTACVLTEMIDEEKGTVKGEMLFEYNHYKKGWQKLQEEFLQEWKNEKIVCQKFYYKQTE